MASPRRAKGANVSWYPFQCNNENYSNIKTLWGSTIILKSVKGGLEP